MVVLNQMAILFLLMLVGMACRKAGIFNDEVTKKLSMLVLNVANPAVILASALSSDSTITGMELLRTAVLSVAMFAGLMFFAHFVPYIIRAKRNEYGIYKCLTIFSNLGFMGLPIVKSLYGTGAVLSAAIFQLPFNILIYTYGIYVLRKDVSDDNTESVSVSSDSSFLKNFLNIGVVSAIAAVILFFLHPAVPGFLIETIDYLGSLTAPLSMMIVGDSLLQINLKELFSNAQMLAYSFIKLLVLPIAGIFIARAFNVEGTLLGVFAVMMATPAGTMNAMLTQQYGGNYKVASEGVALTTLLSVATITIVFMLCGIH